MSKQRANALGDYANFFLHFGFVSGIAGGALIAIGFPPVAGAMALGITAGLKFGLLPKMLDEFQKAINEERKAERSKERVPEHLRKMGFERMEPEEELPAGKALRLKAERWVREAARKMGLEEVPQLLLMSPNKPYENLDKNSLRGMLLKTFNKHANAFAFAHERGNVVLTAPLAKTLNDDELKGVIAHEVGHLAAEHTWYRRAMGFVSTPAKLLTGLNQLFTVVTSVKNIGLYIGANIIAKTAGDVYKSYAGLDAESEKDKARLGRFIHYTRQAALAGLGVAFAAPDLLAAQAVNFLTKEGINLVEKRYSRCNEFQADRLAVQITQDPKAMCTALQKIKREHLKAEPGFNYTETRTPANDRSALSDLFARAKDINKTHPNVERRCDAIMDIKLPTYAMPAPLAA